MQDHVLRPRHAFDFGDEVTIGGRDAVSSSSAFVSDRLGSLSYHKSDHPTLNAAAALGRTRANQLPVALGLSVQTSGADQFGRCVTCAAVLLVRLAPPVTVSPRYAGGL